MILVDSSAWVEYLRDTGSAVCDEVQRELLGGSVAVTEPVELEVLAGARDKSHAGQLRALLGRGRLLRCEPADYESGALIYRACRARGETVRSLMDCLIASVAIRHSVPVLQIDRDMEAIARHTPLATCP